MIISMLEDGRVLHGSTWITPSDYQAAEVARGELGSMKGVTPPEWPTLDGDQVDDPPTRGMGVKTLG